MVSYDTPELVVQVMFVRVECLSEWSVTYESMTRKCGRSVAQVLFVRVDIGLVIYEGITQQCGRSGV